MIKLGMSMDRLVIDPDEINFDALLPEIKKGMSDILADHGRKYDARQGPDGTAQKRNSPGYAARKSSPGIKVGGRRVRGEVPTILTGEMKSSRAIRTRGKSVEAFFAGADNAKKARSLIAKGYKLHYFSDANIKLLEVRINNALPLEKAIRVRRAT